MRRRRTGFRLSNTVLAVILLVMCSIVIYMLYKYHRGPKPITDFQSCVAAGQPVLLSYPEQCTYKGRSFINQEHLKKFQ